MKISEAIYSIENVKDSFLSKNELKHKAKLISLLRELELKDFTKRQNSLLEDQLTRIFEQETPNSKDITKCKESFYFFLETEMLLTYEGYWKICGALVGIVFAGAMIPFISYSSYLIVANGFLIFGFIAGAAMDASLERQGRTLKTWP